jgi:hypothetical protein
LAGSADRPRPAEQGTILITAIWLLILIGAIGPVMLAHSLTQARQVKSEGQVLASKVTLESAINHVLADRLSPRNPQRLGADADRWDGDDWGSRGQRGDDQRKWSARCQ